MRVDEVMSMIGVSRMSQINSAAARGIDPDDFCKNDEERKFYAQMIAQHAVMRKYGIGIDQANEFP